MKRCLVMLSIAAVVYAQEAAPARDIPQKNSSFIDEKGVAHITRVVPVPATLSKEAQAFVARPIPDTDPHLSVEEMRAWAGAAQVKTSKDGQARYPTTLAADTIAGVPVKIVTPPGIPADRRNRVLINLHAGSFMADFGSATETMPIASMTKTKVVSVLYRLQPEHAFPAAVDDVVAVYEQLLESYRPANIAIYGTSSGAALAAEVAVKLKQKGTPLPAALAILSGWGDFASSTDSIAMFGLWGLSGPTAADCSGCSMAAYVGKTDPRDPVLSPIYADLKGMPPTLFITSTRDLLLSGTTMLHRAFLKAGVPAELVVFEGLPHAFWATGPRDMPEAIEVHQIVAAFLDRQLARKR